MSSLVRVGADRQEHARGALSAKPVFGRRRSRHPACPQAPILHHVQRRGHPGPVPSGTVCSGDCAGRPYGNDTPNLFDRGWGEGSRRQEQEAYARHRAREHEGRSDQALPAWRAVGHLRGHRNRHGLSSAVWPSHMGSSVERRTGLR